MQIELSSEAARLAELQAHNAGIENVEAYLNGLVREQDLANVRRQPPSHPRSKDLTFGDQLTRKNESHQEWSARLAAFVAKQTPVLNEVDDSRDAIYSDHD